MAQRLLNLKEVITNICLRQEYLGMRLLNLKKVITNMSVVGYEYLAVRLLEWREGRKQRGVGGVRKNLTRPKIGTFAV